jgi:hypothetical protein
MDARSEVHDRPQEVTISEWLSETTNTIMKYVVTERIDGRPARSQLCESMSEAEQIKRSWSSC